METVEKISVLLPPDMVALMRDAVESGEYASASEVIREALWAWKFRRKVETLETDELREVLREGAESGPGVDADLVFARLRTKYGKIAE